MNNDKWLLAISAGRWQLAGIRAAKAAGLKVIAVDNDPSAAGFAAADERLVLDIKDPEPIRNALAGIGLRPDGVIAFCNESGLSTVARLREHYSLPGIRSDSVAVMTHKHLQRKLWTEAGVPCPVWHVVNNVQEARSAFKAIGGVSILKPVDSAGSRGVRVVSREQDVAPAFAHAQSLSSSGTVILEEFVVGTEHTIETLTDKGRTVVLAVTKKKKVPGTDNTVASELASPDYPPELVKKISQTCIDALAALKYTDGPGHTEMLLTPQGRLVLVETACRGGGFMVADGVVPRASGFDLSGNAALQAVGKTLEWPPKIERKAVVLRFVPSLPGRIVSISGFAPGDDLPNALSEPIVKVGQILDKASCDGDRMAYILSWADTPAEAQRLADEREKRIGFVVE